MSCWYLHHCRVWVCTASDHSFLVQISTKWKIFHKNLCTAQMTEIVGISITRALKPTPETSSVTLSYAAKIFRWGQLRPEEILWVKDTLNRSSIFQKWPQGQQDIRTFICQHLLIHAALCSEAEGVPAPTPWDKPPSIATLPSWHHCRLTSKPLSLLANKMPSPGREGTILL